MSAGAATAIVAGAGIGGLAAAIGLRRVGLDVRVVEQRAEPGAIGAGIALFPNALRAFDAIGVGDVVRAVTARPLHGGGGLRLPSGRWLLRVRDDGVPQLLSCHRNDLHAALLGRLPHGVVQAGTELVDVRPLREGVEVRLRRHSGTGSPQDELARADVLVGADGVGSVVRSRLWPAVTPRYAGYTAWRAVTASGDWGVAGGETWGRGTRFGIVPIAGDRVYWFATANRPAGSGAGLGARQRYAEVVERFASWHDPIPRLLAATAPEDVLQHDIAWIDPPLASFVTGRVALLGDAAHAMTPDLGQGACQAVEDAALLAAVLARHVADPSAVPVEGCLRDYDVVRRPRTQRIARTAARLGRFAQADGLLTTGLRTSMMRVVPASIARSGSGWILGWPAPEVPVRGPGG